MTTPEQIKHWIEDGLAHSVATVQGDGHHFDAVVVCAQFEGKNTLARQRMVYAALGEKMDQAIHALSFKTRTPEEFEKESL